MTFHIVSIFPESLGSYLGVSILGRAQEGGHIRIKYYNPRDFVLPAEALTRSGRTKTGRVVSPPKLTYAERRVDDRPYGGGPGMVMETLPVARAVEAAVKEVKGKKSKTKIVFFSPSGKQFTNEAAESWKKYTDIILVCGRYEGIDARVKKIFKMTDISVGPYTLTGGELPAAIVMDAVTRRIEGVLGDSKSIEEKRVAGPDVYTRPEVVEYKGKKYRVPKILLGGHHSKINDWKMKRK